MRKINPHYRTKVAISKLLTVISLVLSVTVLAQIAFGELPSFWFSLSLFGAAIIAQFLAIWLRKWKSLPMLPNDDLGKKYPKSIQEYNRYALDKGNSYNESSLIRWILNKGYAITVKYSPTYGYCAYVNGVIVAEGLVSAEAARSAACEYALGFLELKMAML